MEFETIDLDRLQSLVTLLREGGVLEFQLGAMRFKFPAPAPTVESVVKGAVDSPNTGTPNGYVQLLGKLPAWPKAS